MQGSHPPGPTAHPQQPGDVAGESGGFESNGRFFSTRLGMGRASVGDAPEPVQRLTLSTLRLD